MSKKSSVEWTRYEVLLPQPSYSRVGQTIEQTTSSRPMVRSILRSQAYERMVNVEDQDRRWTAMAKAKHAKDKDPAVAAWEHELALRRAEARKNRSLPFARPGPPLRPEPTPPKPEPMPHPKSTLPDLERRLARERRRAGQKPKGHPSTTRPDRYSETPVHQRFAERKVFEHLPPEVARERSIITSGRRFTWGGRQKLTLPGFNPNRERQLREKVSKF